MSTVELVSSNLVIHSIDTPQKEILSTDTLSNQETTPSQQSENIIENENQLKLNAQAFVDDSMQSAETTYKKVSIKIIFY